MRLTDFTDYGLRALVYAAIHPERLVTIHEISDAFHIPHSHLMKVVHALGKAQFLVTVRGRKGGVRLAMEPTEIRVGNVVRALEPDFRLAECFSSSHRGHQCVIAPVCDLRGTMQRALDAYLAVLDESTLADLVVRSDALLALIHPGATGRTIPVVPHDAGEGYAVLHGPVSLA